MKKRILTIMLSTVLAAGMLVGCGNKTDTGTTETNTVNTEAVSTADANEETAADEDENKPRDDVKASDTQYYFDYGDNHLHNIYLELEFQKEQLQITSTIGFEGMTQAEFVAWLDQEYGINPDEYDTFEELDEARYNATHDMTMGRINYPDYFYKKFTEAYKSE